MQQQIKVENSLIPSVRKKPNEEILIIKYNVSSQFFLNSQISQVA